MVATEIEKTLYLTTHRSKLGVSKGNLVVTVEGKSTKLPVTRVRQIILMGSVQVSSEAFALCARKGVLIADISRGGNLRYVVQPRTSGNVLLRLAQYDAFRTESKLRIACAIVSAKIRNSQELVVQWSKSAKSPARENLRQIERQLMARAERAVSAWSLDQVRGIEGDSAYLYFRAMGAHLDDCNAPLRFQHRNRRPPRDPMNALLSFVYALIHAEARGALDAVGLDPQVGYLHEPRPGRASLALDIMEELRPSIADRFAVRCVARRQFGQQHFEARPGGGVFLAENGLKDLLALYDDFKQETVRHPSLEREIPRWSLPTVQATLLARYLRGDISRYHAFCQGDDA